jgi:ferrochelatase
VALADAGVDVIVGLVLAPHFSRASVGQYQERLAAAAAARGVPTVAIESWHLEATYLSFLTAAVQDALRALPVRTKVLFTAHALPERALVDDPYPAQLQASAGAVAEAVGLDRWAGWSACWQSAGRTPERWSGPDVGEVIRDLAATGRADGVLVCPHGFVSDHLEVLYDLDIVARQVAEDAGLAFARTRVLNADPTVLAALAERVLEAAP